MLVCLLFYKLFWLRPTVLRYWRLCQTSSALQRLVVWSLCISLHPSAFPSHSGISNHWKDDICITNVHNNLYSKRQVPKRVKAIQLALKQNVRKRTTLWGINPESIRTHISCHRTAVQGQSFNHYQGFAYFYLFNGYFMRQLTSKYSTSEGISKWLL